MKKRVISILLGLVFVLALIIVPFSVPVRASSLSDETIWMFLVQATGSAAGYHISSSGTEHGGSGGMFPDFYSDMFTQWQASYGGDAMALNTWIDGNVALSGEGTNVEFTVLEGGGGIDPITGTAIDAMGFLIAQALVDKMAEFWGWFNENILGATSADSVDGVNAGVGGNFGEAPVTSISGLTLVSLPISLYRSSTQHIGFDGPASVAIAFVPAANDVLYPYFFSSSPFTAYYHTLTTSNNPTWSSITGELQSCGLYVAHPTVNFSSSAYEISSSLISTISNSDLQTALSSSTSQTVSDVATTVGYKPGIETIEFPESDPESDPEEEPAPVPYIFPQEWPNDLPAPDPGTGAVPADDAIPWIIDGFTGGDGDISYADPEAEPDPDNPTPSRPIQSPGLADVFPFCLPFDVYHFFQALAAEPVAPHFEWEMVIPGIIDYTWVIDLSAFNSVAQILRTVELLAFCVGLAFVTRSMFIRG